MLSMIIELIRKIIKTSGKSLNQISRNTKVDVAALSRIMNGGDCKTITADKLLKYFGLGIKSKAKSINIPSTPQNSNYDKFAKFHRQSWQNYTNPDCWMAKAETLYEAANAFREKYWPIQRKEKDAEAGCSDFQRGPVYMLLAGLAIETLIKGIMVGKNPNLVEPQKLSQELTHHNLLELYRAAGMRESNSRNNLLLRLQNYVEIFGRYPVTKTKKEMEKMSNTRFAGQTDPERVDRLWNYLVSKIQAYIQKVE